MYVDTILKRATVDPTGNLLANKDDALHVGVVGTTGSCELELLPCLPDMIFYNRAVDAQHTSSLCELQKAQTILPYGRKELMEAHGAAQARLDHFHHMFFAHSARANMRPNSVGAQLSSVRFEAQFASPRRTRAMRMMRVAANAETMEEIEVESTSLAEAAAFDSNPQLLDGLPEIHCAITRDSLQEEMMTFSHSDVMAFELRVSRPENTVEVPTQIRVEAVQMGGVYCSDAWRRITRHRIDAVGASMAHGGLFDKSRPGDGRGDYNHNQMTGLFCGADGKYMNGCLPLHLGPAHWARVRHLPRSSTHARLLLHPRPVGL